MEPSQLLNGLNPDSLVTPRMLGELTALHERLARRSSINDNWTEQDQHHFELVHAIVHRWSDVASAVVDQ